MRATPNLAVERHRERTGLLASSRFDGNNGAFVLPVPAGAVRVIVSDQLGWEHVSVVARDADGIERTPSYAEMDHVKRLFWRDDETVMQLHVPRTDHVNVHPHCLHLWRPVDAAIPLPPAVMV